MSVVIMGHTEEMCSRNNLCQDKFISKDFETESHEIVDFELVSFLKFIKP